jgi:5'-deoxynucleotidase YfbR-like HD superfamily hydrolase
MNPYIQTHTGLAFSLIPDDTIWNDQRDIRIEDIAHALSHLCRFTGHTRTFYSVAEHSVRASYEVPPHLALDALLHDATEAYLGDVSSPLKSLLPDYRKIEDMLSRRIAIVFGTTWPMLPEVKHADLVMLATEKRDLMGNDSGEGWSCLDGIEPCPEIIVSRPPTHAKAWFLTRYDALLGERAGKRLIAA